MLIFKLRQGASIRANVCLSVGLSVEKIKKFKKSNSLIIFDYLINFGVWGAGGGGVGGT